MVLIKGEILNTTGMAWVATSEKWKAPLIKAHFPNDNDVTMVLALNRISAPFGILL